MPHTSRLLYRHGKQTLINVYKQAKATASQQDRATSINLVTIDSAHTKHGSAYYVIPKTDGKYEHTYADY